MAQHTLDCKNMACPMPIVHISKKMRTLEPGDTLVVEATDPAFKADVSAWAKRLGHTIERFEEGSCVTARLIKT